MLQGENANFQDYKLSLNLRGKLHQISPAKKYHEPTSPPTLERWLQGQKFCTVNGTSYCETSLSPLTTSDHTWEEYSTLPKGMMAGPNSAQPEVSLEPCCAFCPLGPISRPVDSHGEKEERSFLKVCVPATLQITEGLTFTQTCWRKAPINHGRLSSEGVGLPR